MGIVVYLELIVDKGFLMKVEMGVVVYLEVIIGEEVDIVMGRDMGMVIGTVSVIIVVAVFDFEIVVEGIIFVVNDDISGLGSISSGLKSLGKRYPLPDVVPSKSPSIIKI